MEMVRQRVGLSSSVLLTKWRAHGGDRLQPFLSSHARAQRAAESRYASRDAWAARLTEATDRLVAERLLLAEDGDRLVAAARESWDVYQAL